MELSIENGILFAKKGSIQELEKWIDSGGNPNQYDKDGWTPLLWAAARGEAATLKLLLEKGADINLAHKFSGALAIHLAGHSGSVECAEIILKLKPEQIDAVWDLNGHTILLQASFYGHLKLAKYLVEKGADTSITTARGLGPMEMAQQFQNKEMMEIIREYDSSAEKKAAYYKSYLAKIAPIIPEEDREQQKLSDELVAVIDKSIKAAIAGEGNIDESINKVRELIEVKKADVNRLGGPLQQPPLIVAVTGNNGLPTVENCVKLRNKIAEMLLENGASPILHEKHPMGAQTIIRGAVFNHLDILKMCEKYLTKQELTDAINEYPVVNGLTALHDTVLRATMAGEDKIEGYFAQTKWFMEHGGRSDIEDFAGRTQKNIAEQCKKENVRKRLLELL